MGVAFCWKRSGAVDADADALVVSVKERFLKDLSQVNLAL